MAVRSGDPLVVQPVRTGDVDLAEMSPPPEILGNTAVKKQEPLFVWDADPEETAKEEAVAGKTTDWWGRLVVALHEGTYEVLAENEVRGQVLVQLPDGSVYSIDRLGATTRD